MSNEGSWNPIDDPVNFILLKGRRSPGLADVEGAALEWRLDVRKMMGMTGGIIVWTGRELCPFTVNLRLYSVQDWLDWDAWKSLVLAKPQTSVGLMPAAVVSAKGAMDITHPLLDDVGIRSCVVKKVYQPKRTEDSGEWTIQIDFLEYRGTPKQLLAKNDGSQAEPVDPVDQKIERLATQVQELAK